MNYKVGDKVIVNGAYDGRTFENAISTVDMVKTNRIRVNPIVDMVKTNRIRVKPITDVEGWTTPWWFVFDNLDRYDEESGYVNNCSIRKYQKNQIFTDEEYEELLV